MMSSAPLKRPHPTIQSIKSKDLLLLELWAQLGPVIRQIFETEVAVSRSELMRLYGLMNNFLQASDTPPAKYGRISGPHIALGNGSCTHRLYSRIQKYLQSRVENLAKKAVEITEDTEILNFYIREAAMYLNGVAQLNFICKSVNNTWVPFANSCEDTGEKIFHEIKFLASMIWKKGIFDRWGKQIASCIIGLIKQEREGGTIDQEMFATVIKSLVNLGYDPATITQLKSETKRQIARANNPDEVQAIKDAYDQRELAVNLSFYRSLFETGFLEATAMYYTNQIEALFTGEALSSVQYINQLWMWLEQEQTRAQSYLHSSTATQILRTILPIAITNHREVFMNGLQDAMSKHPPSVVAETFKIMHKLCGALGEEAIQELAEKVKQQVVFQVDLNLQKDIIDKNHFRDVKTYIKIFNDQYKYFSQLVAENIRNDTAFVGAVQTGISDALGSNAVIKLDNRMGKSHEFLATRYHMILDNNLSKRENLSQDKITSTLKDLNVLFSLLPNTPTFETVYCTRLCSRIVDGSSVSDEFEEQVIKDLAQHRGNSYVEKLYTVFRDWKKSVDAGKDFKKYCEKETNPLEKITISLEVTIFNHHAPLWSQEKQTLILPKELTKTLQSFEKFYSEYVKKRHLQWIHSRSKGEIQASQACFSDKKNYIFQCSLFQMSVILLFADKDTLNFDEIVQTVGLDASLTSQVLYSLVSSKLLLLENKKPGEVVKNFKNEDNLSLNKDYTNNRTRVNLNANIRTEQQKKDDDKVSKIGEDDIKFILQSAIVRIMKTHKTIKETDLIVAVIGELVKRKIHADPASIKSVVDLLITREFMKSREGTPTTYEYLS